MYVMSAVPCLKCAKEDKRQSVLRQWDTYLQLHGLHTPLQRLYAPPLTEEEADEIQYEIDSDEESAEKHARRARLGMNADFLAYHRSADAVMQRAKSSCDGRRRSASGCGTW